MNTMPITSVLRVVTVVAFLGLPSAPALAADYKLYFLGGQSNMDGYGYTKDLPQELAGEVEGVRIFCGNPAPDGDRAGGRGMWTALKPGFGVGFKSDGKSNGYSDRFGPELTFGRRIRELHGADRAAKIAIIKYSRGGTAIDPESPNTPRFGCWKVDFTGGDGDAKGVNQFDHFVACVKEALATKDIDGDGTDDTLIPAGIVWMQGESDALSEDVAKRYEANLKDLIAHIRQELAKAARVEAQVPVVIGQIADSKQDAKDGKMMDFLELVQAGQAAFVKNDGRAALVTSTSGYTFSDPWHYDSPAYIDLGKQFAEALVKAGEKRSKR